LLRDDDISIFQNGGGRHLGFLKFKNFNSLVKKFKLRYHDKFSGDGQTV